MYDAVTMMLTPEHDSNLRRTTILCVRQGQSVAMGSDGQVTLNNTITKHTAQKLRRLYHQKILVGFSGAAADAFALLERFDAKLQEYHGNLLKSAFELAKEWRTDRVLRRLESLMIAADENLSLLISGSGDIIEPDDGVVGIGSGGQYAAAAARALVGHTELPPRKIVEESLKIAASICVYTNDRIFIEELP
jgi:ATP-dependent HslUV protease subunit HslV